MKIKQFIKKLESYDPNLEIGANVITPAGSEFWILDGKSFQVLDKKTHLSILNLRLNKDIEARVIKQLKSIPVASLRCSPEELIERFSQRYDLAVGDKEVCEFSDQEALMFFTEVIKQDIEDMTILLEDFKALAKKL